MAYRGERLMSCGAVPFDWHQAHVVVVSGTGPNLCGHAMVNAGRFYFHVDGLNDYPWFMNAQGYKRYLHENGKREIYRRWVQIPDPDAAQAKLEEYSIRRWRWLVLPNNCASFVEEVFKAGGSDVGSWTNCPRARWA
ncbi:hypothetical protein [Azohydromonas aeria]|uniref:hypothetical protein n=1 Tax=Azohydromonas aeria TaxID=2590212 RepID=UPI0012FAC8F3|nr:hypothetical protein [Azohydromonas aeria]